MYPSFMQFAFKNLVFAFQFNEMRLNCHTKPPRWKKTSDLIRTRECTRARESVEGIENGCVIFPRPSVTNRDYGTRLSLRAAPSGTILPPAASTTFRNLIRVSANVH